MKGRRFGGFSTGKRLIHAIFCMRYDAQRGPRLYEGECDMLSSMQYSVNGAVAGRYSARVFGRALPVAGEPPAFHAHRPR
jgi:hypothetical protein